MDESIEATTTSAPIKPAEPEVAATTTLAPPASTTLAPPATTTLAPPATTTLAPPATTTLAPPATTTRAAAEPAASTTVPPAQGTAAPLSEAATSAPAATTTAVPPAATPAAPGPTVALTVAQKVDDGVTHLPDSLQLEDGLVAVLSWTAANATGVELTGPDGRAQSLSDLTGTLEVSPVQEVNDYSMVAISGDVRSTPATVHISTHLPGLVYSPHAVLLAPGGPPQILQFVVSATGDAASASGSISANPRQRLRFFWQVSGVVRKLEIDSGVGDVTQFTDANQDDGSGSGQTEVAFDAPEGAASITYQLTLTPADISVIPLVAQVTVQVDALPHDDEARRYDWVKQVITTSPVIDWALHDRHPDKGVLAPGGRFDEAPWRMNVLALRGWIDGKGKTEKKRDAFRDTFYVAYTEDNGRKRCEAFLASTDPGIQTGKDSHGSPLNNNSHLLPNQYRYRRAHHSHEIGSRQAEPFFWWNDGSDQHTERQKSDATNSAIKGLNNHASGQHDDVKVGFGSEGCQVLWGSWERHDAPVQRYFWLISRDPVGVYRYTLKDADDLDEAAAAFANLSPNFKESSAREPRLTQNKVIADDLGNPLRGVDDYWLWNDWESKTFFADDSDAAKRLRGTAAPRAPEEPKKPASHEPAAPPKAAPAAPPPPPPPPAAPPPEGELTSIFFSQPQILAWYADTKAAPMKFGSANWRTSVFPALAGCNRMLLKENSLDKLTDFQKSKGLPATGTCDKATALALDRELLAHEHPLRYAPAQFTTQWSDSEDQMPEFARRCVEIERSWEAAKIAYTTDDKKATIQVGDVTVIEHDNPFVTPIRTSPGGVFYGTNKTNCTSSTFAAMYWACRAQINSKFYWDIDKASDYYALWQIRDGRLPNSKGAAEVVEKLGIGKEVTLSADEESACGGDLGKILQAKYDKLRPGDLIQGWKDTTGSGGHSFYVTQVNRDAAGNVGSFKQISAVQPHVAEEERHTGKHSPWKMIFISRYYKLVGE
jgi:hypothetical protein